MTLNAVRAVIVNVMTFIWAAVAIYFALSGMDIEAMLSLVVALQLTQVRIDADD